MSDLVVWLTNILDEDEAGARGCGEGIWSVDPYDTERVTSPDGFDTYNHGGISEEIATHIARHDPAWVLADIAAKRAVITLLWAAEDMAKHTTGVTAVDAMQEGRLDVATAVVRRLASAYAARPGYDESWRP